jgi:uncharacterized protein (DUF1330 family)
MKANYKLALAVLTGASIGAAGASVIYARQNKPAPGYVVAEIEVTDPAAMQQYGAKMPETLAPFNHSYLIRGGKTQPLEGEAPKNILIMSFDSVEKAREWYDSPTYQAIKPIRQSAAKTRIFIAEGVVPK